MKRKTPRRELLHRIGLVGAVSAGLPLAGCGAQTTDGGNGGTGGNEPTPTPTATPTSGDGGQWVKTSSVDMTDELTFEPERIEVAVGTTVTWTTVGSVGHTVTAYEDGIPSGADDFASGGFDSEQAARDGYPDGGNVPEGESYEHTFDTAGQFEYFCIPHEQSGMVGYVTVV